MRIVLLGFGLIGGSLARAVRLRHPTTVIVAWSPSGGGPRRAVAEGVLDASVASVQAGLNGADLIVLAAPPVPSLELLRQLAGPLRGEVRPEATITDVASTKARLLAVADGAGLPFVGGHPMAGRETAGYESADADLFVDRPWVVVAGHAARPADVERVEWLARAVGANPVRMGADEHDRAVAAISHLPLVLSAALVEAVAGAGTGRARPDWATAEPLAASGWRDMTRLARGDVDMGAGIAATNAAPLATRLRDVRAVLDAWIADLDAAAGAVEPDTAAFATRLRHARDRLEGS